LEAVAAALPAALPAKVEIMVMEAIEAAVEIMVMEAIEAHMMLHQGYTASF
jgi:hypothetical protein